MLCDNCKVTYIYAPTPEDEHGCLADVNRCVDGKECPDYIDHCCCKQCYE